MDRRDFLKTAAVVAAGVATLSGTSPAADLLTEDKPPLPLGGATTRPEEQRKGDMIYRALGKTGEMVSLIGLGGHHIGRLKEEQESIRLIRAAIDRGITFMDNCWDYHDGKSEIWMGKALKDGYRAKVFLMSKIDARTKKDAAKQIDESLLRLGVDHVDLMQHHEMIRVNDSDIIFGEAGAQAAMEEAKKAGKVRFIGFTGHKDPFIHLRTLEAAAAAGVRFDTVQMPLNVLDAHFRSFARQVVPEALKQGTAILGMKSLAEGAAIKDTGVSAIECLHYAMTLPTSVVITGIEKMEILDQAMEAARTFKPLSEQQIANLLKRTEAFAEGGKKELYKTAYRFDGTIKNPKWLGETAKEEAG